jgi:hypothetical protein
VFDLCALRKGRFASHKVGYRRLCASKYMLTF